MTQNGNNDASCTHLQRSNIGGCGSGRRKRRFQGMLVAQQTIAFDSDLLAGAGDGVPLVHGVLQTGRQVLHLRSTAEKGRGMQRRHAVLSSIDCASLQTAQDTLVKQEKPTYAFEHTHTHTRMRYLLQCRSPGLSHLGRVLAQRNQLVLQRSDIAVQSRHGRRAVS